jgi:cyclase
MLAKRIIPCLDVTGGRVVKGVNFVELRDAGDPVEIAARYNDQGADEITFLDITATSDGRDVILHIIEAVASQVFIPLTVGGGVRTVADVRRLLNAGADKVSFNSAAVANPQVIRDASDKYGAQCIVVAIDAKRRMATTWLPRPGLGRLHPRRPQEHRPGRRGLGAPDGRDGRRRDPADQHGPRRHQDRLRPGTDPRRERRGAGAGDRIGRRGCAGTPVRRHPVGGADAVLAASIFHYGEFTVGQAKALLARDGIPVRL